MPPKVSAIIINYNGQNCIEECLHSLKGQSHPPDEIVVVDNASTDNSPNLIRSNFPDCRIIQLERNLGYPAACNIGIEETTYELVAILNNDIIFDKNWLRSLLASESDDYSFWASKIVFASNPQRVDSAGDGMAVVGSAYKIGHGDLATDHNTPKEVFGPCGAAALYRRSMLEEVGGFDQDFFLVYEDADLSMRARLMGHRCLYVPDAIVKHWVNLNIGTLSHTYVFFGHRNSEYVFWKNMPTSMLVRYLPERLLFNILSLAFFTLKGRGGSFLQGKKDFLKNLTEVLRKRKAVQRDLRISTKELFRQLDRNWFRYRRKAIRN